MNKDRKIKEITEYPVIGKSKVTVFSYKNNLLERKVEYDELGPEAYLYGL